MREFDVAKYHAEPVIIYGAGTFGEYTLLALRRHGIEPVCFCDRGKVGETILGVKVQDCDSILNTAGAVVLLAVGTALREVTKFLRSNGIANIYSIYRFVFEGDCLDVSQISVERRDVYYFKHLYQFALECLQDGRQGLFTLDWVITEQCSLRCRDCSNLMQYYASPCNFSVAELQRNLDRALEVAEKVFDLRVLGGEPFMNPALADIIEKYLEDERVVNIAIYTNASILPREEMFSVLKHPKVKCQISNYGSVVKNYSQFVACMQDHGIRYTITEIGLWQDLGRLEDRKKTEEEMAATFRGCECNNMFTLLGDKIYRCPFSAHGRNLDAIPDKEEDRVSLWDSVGYARKKLKYLTEEKEFDYACGFCSGRSGGSIEPAVQSERPLPYKKWNEENDG